MYGNVLGVDGPLGEGTGADALVGLAVLAETVVLCPELVVATQQAGGGHTSGLVSVRHDEVEEV